jgi:hypothetical protein
MQANLRHATDFLLKAHYNASDWAPYNILAAQVGSQQAGLRPGRSSGSLVLALSTARPQAAEEARAPQRWRRELEAATSSRFCRHRSPQVGNWSDDRVYWGRPEDVNANRTTRPVFTVNINSPGADVAAQTAAALAAASLVLDASDEAGLAYQEKLLKHARWLYGFAKQVSCRRARLLPAGAAAAGGPGCMGRCCKDLRLS